MTSLAQINGQAVPVITHQQSTVITTEMLAKFYGTEPVRIRQNQHENKSRFIEGKHFFKIAGQELKDFAGSLKLLTNNPFPISPKTRSLILWTERGAARHAKMLDTDQAWDVFEMLEDSYFILKEENREPKTTTADREPLNKAIVMLVAASGRLNYSDAYKLVHQRFGVEHTHELTPLQLNEAVEYVHRLISGNAQLPSDTYELMRKFTESTLSQNFILRNGWEALRLISPQDAAYYNRYIADTNQLARKVSIALDFRNRQNQPLISSDGSVIHFQSGVMFTGINPKWFSMRN